MTVLFQPSRGHWNREAQRRQQEEQAAAWLLEERLFRRMEQGGVIADGDYIWVDEQDMADWRAFRYCFRRVTHRLAPPREIENPKSRRS
uniref:Uncharacterized protein n=1 Tax=Leersia perrieri TaxID=77586 RepID=A0A0D9V910_9ORYZ